MRKVSVEVLEDVSRPEGGYAVVLLHGLASLPDGVTFRLKPVDARGSGDPTAGKSWPQGEQRPLAVRGTDAGMELLIGPEIVECRALLPGTLGVIELQAAGVRGEFLWPSIRPTARPRRRNLSVVKSNPQRGDWSRAGIDAAPSVQRAGVVVSGENGRERAQTQRLREASGGTMVPHDADGSEGVPVTALDHAAPATATVADAVRANVVHLNVGRAEPVASTSLPASEPGPAAGASDTNGAGGGAGAAVTAAPAGLVVWSSARTRMTAIAACSAVVVSGGFLWLGERSEAIDRAAQNRSAVAQDVARAEARPPAMTRMADAESVSPAERVDTQAADSDATRLPQTGTAGEQRAAPASEREPSDAAALPTQASVAPASVSSQEVVLRMRGGGFQIAGELKGFDGTKYVIESRSAGLLTMDATRFECVGEVCSRPAAAIVAPSERPSPAKPDMFRIEGAPALAAEFIPQLIRDYAQSIGAGVAEIPREAPGQGQGAGQGPQRYRIADPRGVELAVIEVQASGTAAGLVALERGAATIALVDRPFVEETAPQRPLPVRRARQGQSAPQPSLPSELVIGLDGIALVTAPASPLATITIDLLARVAAGQITDWYDLGQAPGPIQLYLPADGTGSLETFARQVLRPRGLEFTRAARRLPSEAEVAEAVTRDPRGLALLSLAAQRGAKAINLETTCGLIVRPTAFAVKTGEYPLVRRLSLQLPPQLAQPSARGLVRIAQSTEVQNALAAGRILDGSIAVLPVEEQAERMAWAANAPAASFDAGELRQMLNDLQGASRLSVTFRFVSGTNELDQRSRREVQRLAAALKQPEFAGRRLILAGFSDSGGKFQASTAAAMRRSGLVRTALLAAAGPGLDPRLLQIKGYGPLAPVACNGTADGTRLNRRVEVWVGGR